MQKREQWDTSNDAVTTRVRRLLGLILQLRQNPSGSMVGMIFLDEEKQCVFYRTDQLTLNSGITCVNKQKTAIKAARCLLYDLRSANLQTLPSILTRKVLTNGFRDSGDQYSTVIYKRDHRLRTVPSYSAFDRAGLEPASCYNQSLFTTELHPYTTVHQTQLGLQSIISMLWSVLYSEIVRLDIYATVLQTASL